MDCGRLYLYNNFNYCIYMYVHVTYKQRATMSHENLQKCEFVDRCGQ